jgi:hypothetical protein
MMRMTQKTCPEFCTKKGHCLKLSTRNALALDRLGWRTLWSRIRRQSREGCPVAESRYRSAES